MISLTNLYRIGLEKEFWLLADDIVLEPALFELPYDEFGFLLELRTTPSSNPEELKGDFSKRLRSLHWKARQLKVKLDDSPSHPMDPKFVNLLAEKYKHPALPDLTKNIYPDITGSHATGLEEKDGKVIGTAGMHVHFSCHELPSMKVLDLPIEYIVKRLDETYWSIIKESGRRRGEWEPKEHGFEYRALPSNVPLDALIKETFSLLNEIERQS